jgi:pyridoxal phosphate enzyme (YggS family)
MTTSRAFSDNDLDEQIAHNLAAIRELITRCGRGIDDVRVVAVTKTFPLDVVDAAWRCGLRDFGENYVDELVEKSTSRPKDCTWHFLGALQSRRISDVAAHADLIESVSRRKEIEILARQSRRPPILLQIDYTGAPQRGGVAPEDFDALVAYAHQHELEVRGVMTVAPPEPEAAREAFEDMAKRAARYELRVLSMGMSDDLELALRAGSTQIRIGRALFGPRSGPLRARGLT